MSVLAGIKTVSDLSRLRELEAGRFRETALAGMAFTGGSVTVAEDGGEAAEYWVDTEGNDSVAHFFGIPERFLPRLPANLRRDVLEWHRGESEEKRVALELDGNELVGIWPARKPMISRSEVAGAIQRAMPADAEIHRIDVTQGQLLVDVSSGQVTTEPRVGDITHGGVRVYSHVSPAHGKKQQPRVSSFWLRLACTNGMTRTEEVGKISLAGSTVDDIIEEMERACRMIWDRVVPRRLEQYAHLTSLPIDESDVGSMVHRLARENGIGEKIESQAIDEIATMPARTMYDVVNLINGFQHRGVRGTQHERLLELPGNVAAEEHRRCPQCLTKLD